MRPRIRIATWIAHQLSESLVSDVKRQLCSGPDCSARHVAKLVAARRDKPGKRKPSQWEFAAVESLLVAFQRPHTALYILRHCCEGLSNILFNSVYTFHKPLHRNAGFYVQFRQTLPQVLHRNRRSVHEISRRHWFLNQRLQLCRNGRGPFGGSNAIAKFYGIKREDMMYLVGSGKRSIARINRGSGADLTVPTKKVESSE